jgi:hypothetical protein
MGSVNNQIDKLWTEFDIIPGGYTGSVQVLDKWVNKPFKDYLREQFEEWVCTNGSRRRPSRAEVAHWVTREWSQVAMATIVNTWKYIGHKVAADDDDYQPGAGQESTGYDEDKEDDDFVLYHVEEDREVPAHILQHNFDNDNDEQSFIMDLPEEERQHAHTFHNGVGFTVV